MTQKSILTWRSHYYRLFDNKKKYPYIVKFFNISISKYYDIDVWNNRNLVKKWLLVDYCTMIFESDNDAMAFKLRWI